MSEMERLWQEIRKLRGRLAELETMEPRGRAVYADSAGDSDTVDLLHAATSGANAHVLATDASGNAQIDGHLLMPTPGQRRSEVAGTNATRYGEIEAPIRKQLTSGSAIATFKITTADETGWTDAGHFAVFVDALVHVPNIAGAVAAASKSYTGQFAHSTRRDGTAADEAVTQVALGAGAQTDAAVATVTTVVMTVATVGYVTTVSFAATVTGTGGYQPIITCKVRVLWGTFITAPVLAVA